METSVGARFVGSCGCSVIGKYCERYLYSRMVVPIVAEDMEVLLEYLDCSLTKSICLQVVCGGET